MEHTEVTVMEDIFERNDKIALETNQALSERGIFTVNIMGAPGVGKTTFLVRLIQLLAKPAFVIEGDIESDIDTKKLLDLGIAALQLNTGGACHLESTIIADAVKTVSLENGYLFIENIGNLVCPAEFIIGEHIKLLISTVTEGSDKPYKYPLAFEKADVIIINKADLSAYVDFDEAYFIKGIQALNKNAPIFKVSAKTGEGFGEVAAWITEQAKQINSSIKK
ncbi:MAG: hydrogenase accessory protein HypB [Clostridiales bacterium 43-6]|nr:MAG: hydrogenase accessory protein HypB [Clostridiales bacterium 43-6]